MTVKVGLAGTHSTGKSTFLDALNVRLTNDGVRVGRIGDLATAARARGFPILTLHNFESTLWIMAEGMRQEAEATLTSDVILVDRPVFDALGYLYAALQISGRALPEPKIDELRRIAEACAIDYDIVILTELDDSVGLGEGRDENHAFRVAAGEQIAAIAQASGLTPLALTSSNSGKMLEVVHKKILSSLGCALQ
ncbi:AAA family ATPase [Agrobacterium tumefaciens]|uniref:AAA family ATPase n=1 Tax=Agrobacterium tumefaciens TaxID=358 RepID=UPI00023A3AEB|nr:hypothetical protein AT5A_25535 [Agrobacterium tumefaciens 5A]